MTKTAVGTGSCDVRGQTPSSGVGIRLESVSRPRVSITLGATASCLCTIEYEYRIPHVQAWTRTALGSWVENKGAWIASSMDSCSGMGEWLFPTASLADGTVERTCFVQSPHRRVDIVSLTLSWSHDASTLELWEESTRAAENGSASDAFTMDLFGDGRSGSGYRLHLSCLVTAVFPKSPKFSSWEDWRSLDIASAEAHCLKWLLEKENESLTVSSPSNFVSLWRPLFSPSDGDHRDGYGVPHRIILVKGLPVWSLSSSLSDISSSRGSNDSRLSCSMSPYGSTRCRRDDLSEVSLRFQYTPGTFRSENESFSTHNNDIRIDIDVSSFLTSQIRSRFCKPIQESMYPRYVSYVQFSSESMDSTPIEKFVESSSYLSENKIMERNPTSIQTESNSEEKDLFAPSPRPDPDSLPRWKSSLVVCIGLFPTLIAWILVFRAIPTFSQLSWPIQALIETLVVVPTMSYFVMYNLIHWVFWRWMYGNLPRPPYRFCAA